MMSSIMKAAGEGSATSDGTEAGGNTPSCCHLSFELQPCCHLSFELEPVVQGWSSRPEPSVSLSAGALGVLFCLWLDPLQQTELTPLALQAGDSLPPLTLQPPYAARPSIIGSPSEVFCRTTEIGIG